MTRRWNGPILAGLLLMMGLSCCPVAAANAASSRTAADKHGGLFERQPPQFTYQTITRLPKQVASLWEEIPKALAHEWEHERSLDAVSFVLVLLLLGAVIYGAFIRRRVARRIAAWIVPIEQRLPQTATPWLAAIAEVAAAAFLPLFLWGFYQFVAALITFERAPLLILGSVLLAWTEYAAAAATAHELMVRPLLPVPPEHGRYLFRWTRVLLIYGLAVTVLLDSATRLGASREPVALFRTLFSLSLIILLGLFFLRRRAIMSLFPHIPNHLYQRFLNGLDRIYPLALTVTVATALLEWAGFVRLADFVWIRTWALVGLFVGAVVLHHLLRLGLGHWILNDPASSESATSFYRSSGRLLDYFGFIVVLLIALHLTGVRDPLMRLLASRFATIGRQPISVLVFVEAAVIVAGFLFVARLLRDYLDFRVYPSLKVDEGVAHAINTFLVYALTIVGGIAALEAVGLGLGTLTLFAGAFGIGAGFGLQSMANNLASGLTLIFSRALRRGDWVTVGDTVGLVQEIGVRATRMRTRDDIEYLVPNSEFVSGKIVNWTRTSPQTRLHVPIGVSYGADPEQVRKILETVATEIPTVLHYPAPEVWFAGFGDSSLNFELLVWINVKADPPRRVTSDLYFSIFRAFKNAAIEIPFPQRDIHIRSVEGPGTSRFRLE
jgi:small-conductance mechanosensitive channel